MRISSLLQALAAVGATCPVLFADAAGTGTRHQLTQASEIRVTANAGGPVSHRLRGSFLLVPQASPLDWRQYTVEQARLETVGDGRVWRGAGMYRIGGRGEPQEEMRLELVSEGQRVMLQTGLKPPKAGPPELDLELSGSDTSGNALVLRLTSVPVLRRWHYQTAGEAWLQDECDDCDRLVVRQRLTGGFDLVLFDANPLFERYHLFDLQLTDGAVPQPTELRGEGEFKIGGEVAMQQECTLDLSYVTAGTNRPALCQQVSTRVHRPWPMIQVETLETNASPLSRLRVNLEAAPLRELWFVAAQGMTPGVDPKPADHLGPIDVLSDRGRLARPGQQLLKKLALVKPPAGLALDALEVLPIGELVFSLNQQVESATLGTLLDGDLLSEQGRVTRPFGELMTRFGVQPPLPDLGLDAARRASADEWWFSLRSPAFSQTLGRQLGRGDILSSFGSVTRANAELLARFQPPDPKHDYGLDAFHVWPSGEIWFSLDEGFQDAALGHIGEGDLLSDQGHVVARNLELVRPFQPLEDLADFGLKALFVISDVQPPSEGARIEIIQRTGTQLGLRWRGPGRVFQVSAAESALEPFSPLSPLVTDTEWVVPVAPDARASRVFQVLSW